MKNQVHFEKWKEELDLKEARLLKTKDIQIATWVPLKCQYGCGDFEKKHSCPPFAPHPYVSSMVLSDYQTAILVHDHVSWKIRWAVTEMERKAVELGYFKAFGLGSGPCGLCNHCDVQEPCINTKDARPSMEAMGIDVFSTVKKLGYSLQFNPTEPKFFGLVLLE